MKDELGREKLKEFVASRPKMDSFLKDDDEKDIRVRVQKNVL